MQANEFNRIQEDILRGRAKSAERVGWFSGASISLSFTLLGFLISKSDFIYLVHTHIFLFIILIFAWICLGLSIIASLLISFLTEKWLYYTSFNLYYGAKTKTPDEEINKINEDTSNYGKEKAKKRALFIIIAERIIYICGISGIFFLVSFLIGLTAIFIVYH